MTYTKEEAAKEYKALLNVKLGFSEIYEAIVNADDLIRKRLNIINDLLGYTNNDPARELCEYTEFHSNAVRLHERLQIMRNLCHDDVGEYADDMDNSASSIIGML